MSYAIVRNEKLTRAKAQGICVHNDRRARNHKNKDIDPERTYLNYYLKKNQLNYVKEFDKLKEKNNLKGMTSDKEFFDKIGEKETKRYFEECYKFACNYKDLGEQNIVSSVVHLDENVPHMHLIYIPVVHTKDKEGNDIDKICARDFWRTKNSYRQLQKKITNFENTKKVLDSISLELQEVPDIKDIKIIKLNREKVENEIIKPKDDLINELYQQNLNLHKELSRQVKLVKTAEKYQKERDKILADNEELHNTVSNLENEYRNKSFDLEWEYKNKIRKLEKENNHLKKVLDKFKDTVQKFIKWIVKKFDITDENKLVRDFEMENHTLIDAEKQVRREDREIGWELER